MPIYEYKCKKGHVFDVMQGINDDPVTTCEVCGSPVSRVFHPPSVHFKGSGFYNTDYGTRKRSREKESADSGGGSGGGSSSDSTTKSSESSSDGKSSSSSSSTEKKSEKKAA